MNIIKLLIIMIVGISLAAIGYLVIKIDQTHYIDACNGLINISKDSEKNLYLRYWIRDRLADDIFAKTLQEKMDINLSNNPDLESYLRLDWEFLGLLAERGVVRFNPYIPRKDRLEKDISSHIKSVSIEQGRMSLIIKVGENDDLGLNWSPQTLAKVRVIDDKISVYCGENE